MNINDANGRFPILVAEDDPVARKILKRTLITEGHEVVSVENGRKAFDLFKERFFPIILTDWMMPEMNGLELCRAVRNHKTSGYVFVIILTSKDSKKDIVTGLNSGADDYVNKPFNPPELKARIKTCMRILELERSLKKANENIRILSITDPLTKCYNRGYIMDRLPQEINRAIRYDRALSLVLCDIDHFKKVNDTYGHQAGDKVLIEFVYSIKQSIRQELDWIARYGGEEFLIVLPETGPEGALIMAERLRNTISNNKFIVHEKAFHITSSFGISGFDSASSDENISSEVLINVADQHLYQFKLEGRNRVLSNSFFNIGIDQLTGGKTAFINFTQELLIRKIPMMFPIKNMTVEILEDVDPNEEVVNACLDISKAGYAIAMDDFVFKNELKTLIKLAHIIKIDFLLSPIEEIRKLVDMLEDYNIRLLAEKIETYDKFEKALSMGFTYFQGYFFSKPEILSGKEITPSKITLLQIVGEANKKDCSFNKLEKLINRDVSISYKLLRYINSAYFKRACEISTIKHAIVLLGEQEIKRFISLVATAELASEKPDELIRASIIRARFCELLGISSRNGTAPSELFLMGLFSLIDAILDNTMKNIMKNLPLSKNIKLALLEEKGELTDYLKLVSSYETANWERCSLMISKINAKKDRIPEYYQNAVNWADSYII